MTSVRFCVLALATMFCLGTFADTNKDAKDNKVAVEDTISAATFSYAFSILQSDGLDKYITSKMGVDKDYLKYFKKGMKAYMKAKSNKKLIAYAAGIQVGKQVKDELIPRASESIIGDKNSDIIDPKIVAAVFMQQILGEKLDMTADSAKNILQQQIEYFNMKKNKKNNDFMNNISQEEGVKELDGGVYYKVLRKGKGVIPSDTSLVVVNYEGRLMDGTVFDSSYKRNKPTSFKANQVIKGWTIALTNMPIGSVWEVYIPYDKAYGEKGTKGIPGYAPLIFKIELLDVK